MSAIYRNAFTLLLSALVLTGSFSRLTHGAYTPHFHAYQTSHLPDDGSRAAQITPIMDAVLGVLLFVPRTRFLAAAIITVFFCVGFVLQLRAGKGVGVDFLTIVLGLLAIRESAAERLTALVDEHQRKRRR